MRSFTFLCLLFQFLLFAAVGSQAGIIAPLAPASYGIALPAAGNAVDYYVSLAFMCPCIARVILNLIMTKKIQL